jgi:hypothetical protein
VKPTSQPVVEKVSNLMNAIIQAQIAAAQKDAARIFGEDQQPFDFDSRKISIGRDVEVKISAPGNIVSSEIVSKRSPEGPKLGGETDKNGSSVHAPDSSLTWGKPSRS